MTATPDAAPHGIIVGIDGSEASKDALRWAARQAKLTGAGLRAVMTWHVPTFAYGAAVPLPVNLDFEESSRVALDQVVADTLGDHPGVEVSTAVVEGLPALVLLEAAETAELLVLGSRGHGAFAGMLLGSVSEHCVSHSRCPVVVVRHDRHPA